MQVTGPLLRQALAASGLVLRDGCAISGRWLDSVDHHRHRGDQLLGDAVPDNPVTYKIGKRRLILVMAAERVHYNGHLLLTVQHYEVVALLPDGSLQNTGIYTSDVVPGWQERIIKRLDLYHGHAKTDDADVVVDDEAEVE